MHLKHQLASFAWPRYNLTVDQVNHLARYRDWLARSGSVPVFDTREELHDHIQDQYCAGEPIDYIELGVYKGESLRLWTQLNRHPKSRFFGLDSFEGLPEAWGRLMPAGALDAGGRIPDIADPRVRFVKGLFQDTLKGFLATFRPRARLVVHHDSDLYSSTLFCLTMLDSILVPGSILIYDNFASALHEFRAHQDYVTAYRRTAAPIGMTEMFTARMAFVVEPDLAAPSGARQAQPAHRDAAAALP